MLRCFERGGEKDEMVVEKIRGKENINLRESLQTESGPERSRSGVDAALS